MSANPILEMRGVTKKFPGVIALNEVTFSLQAGECQALIGENGAGKSTLMKVLGGVHQPTSGEIWIEGEKAEIHSVADATELGIGFVHQELNVLDNIDVAGNIFLGREPRKLGLINRRKMAADARPFLSRLGLNIDPSTLVKELTIGQQQLVEIAKALSMDARIIIMDEPTSSLTLQETDCLLKTIESLKNEGISVIYISHRLSEVKECADQVVALRDGQNAGDLRREEITHDAMVSLMVGRDLKQMYDRTETTKSPGYFKVKNLRTTYCPEVELNFDVAAGEILGFAGLVGAGRSEMAQAIFGVDTALSGSLELAGKVLSLNTKEAIRNGLYLAPEDRKKSGLVLDMSIRENMSLASLAKYSKNGLINRKAEKKLADEQMASMKIKAPDDSYYASTLSGGNQQKIVLGKWMSMNPKVIIFDEPTRGIDVGARSEIYKLMHNLAEKGVAIIMISSDMEEILGVADRIAVMHEGHLTGFLERNEFSEEAVMQLAVK
jgi:ribose transport system ATP-binding protein